MSTILVEFEDAWLCDVANPAVSVHASFPDRGHSKATAGEVRPYAGGRLRVITSGRKSATYPLTLQLLTKAEVVLVELWQGRVLLLRDGAGLRVFGTILAGDVVDYWDEDGTLSDMATVFTELTYDESV